MFNKVNFYFHCLHLHNSNKGKKGPEAITKYKFQSLLTLMWTLRSLSILVEDEQSQPVTSSLKFLIALYPGSPSMLYLSKKSISWLRRARGGALSPQGRFTEYLELNNTPEMFLMI